MALQKLCTLNNCVSPPRESNCAHMSDNQRVQHFGELWGNEASGCYIMIPNILKPSQVSSTELHNVERLELVSGLTVRLCTGGRLLV